MAVIHFDIVQTDTITLVVFNLMGDTVRTFFKKIILPGGSYNINLYGDGLHDGIYMVQLNIGSKKRLLQKAMKLRNSTSIADNKAEGKLLLFPNPTKDQLTIPVEGIKTIIVSDLNGKTIKSFHTAEQVISLSDIPAGQYFITVLTNKNELITTQKVVKKE